MIDKGLSRRLPLPQTASARRVRITLLELILRQILKQMVGKKRKQALRAWRKYEQYAKSKPVIRRTDRKAREPGGEHKVNLFEQYLRDGINEDNSESEQ
jgi:hypothetical protein